MLVLTERHLEVLRAMGLQGSTREQLGEILERPAFGELLITGYLIYKPIISRETVVRPGESGEIQTDVWYFTAVGAAAIGVDPGLLPEV